MDTRTRQLYNAFLEYHQGLANASPVDSSEGSHAKRRRMEKLEASPEAWFAYYFAAYATAEPAPFHKAATRRVLANPEWYEVRSWSRELAKSTRTMMEVLYLTLTGRKRNTILVSNSKENADRLLLPYMVNLEKNHRIINDYGIQQSLGTWTTGEFITRGGAAFRAIGAGQSPRGTRNEAARPDIILVDDIDTDQDCQNPEIIDKRWDWIEQALFPTRSISNPMLIIFCGNIIAEDCCVVRAAERADKVDIVNIRDAQGVSTWPSKNSEEHIDRALSTLSYASQQKEYYNTPMTTSKTFPEIKWGKCPPLNTLPFAVIYADPAPGNKDRPGAKSTNGNSRKAVFVAGKKDDTYYVYTGFLDVVGSHRFITQLYDCHAFIRKSASALPVYCYIENNSLQDPFYDQVYRPLIHTMGAEKGNTLSVMPDRRKKPEKWFRIEATLQPLVASGRLVFNADEKDNEHMKRLEAQFKAARANSRQLDGPDCIEGAVVIINEKIAAAAAGSIRTSQRTFNEKKAF